MTLFPLLILNLSVHFRLLLIGQPHFKLCLQQEQSRCHVAWYTSFCRPIVCCLVVDNEEEVQMSVHTESEV